MALSVRFTCPGRGLGVATGSDLVCAWPTSKMVRQLWPIYAGAGPPAGQKSSEMNSDTGNHANNSE